MGLFVFPTHPDLLAPVDPNDREAGTYVEQSNTRDLGVLSRAARTAFMPPREDEGDTRKPEHTRFIPLPDYPRQTNEQGVGKSAGFQMPWRRTWESLINPILRQRPNWRVWKELPSRPEQAGWSAAYLLYFEQRSRHVWPGGASRPGRIIEHPETAPLTLLARGIGKP